MTVGSGGALFVVTYVDFLQEILEQDPDAGQNGLVQYGAASSKANPGNLLSYTVLRQIDRPNRYVFLEVWDAEPHYVTWQDSAVTKSFIARNPLARLAARSPAQHLMWRDLRRCARLRSSLTERKTPSSTTPHPFTSRTGKLRRLPHWQG
jgi:quinol monooxygenase YgiN